MRLISFSLATSVFLQGCSSGTSSPSPSVTVSSASPTANPTSPPSQPPASTRPFLVQQKGEYYKWLAPDGWHGTDTPNGADLKSPDGSLLVTADLLRGNRGESDPWNFTVQLLGSAGMKEIKGVSSRDLPPPARSIPGTKWALQEFELTFTDPSLGARRANVVCGICNGYGGFDALFQGFSTPPDDYDKNKSWLYLVAGSFNAIDASKVAYQADLIPVVNHPWDDSAVMGAWEARRKSQDPIDQKRRETTMGYERMISPIDGRTYDMPFELYDGTMNGYRDPADHNQILKHAPPGE